MIFSEYFFEARALVRARALYYCDCDFFVINKEFMARVAFIHFPFYVFYPVLHYGLLVLVSNFGIFCLPLDNINGILVSVFDLGF